MNTSPSSPVLPPNRQSIYNPSRLTDAEVKASYIAREGLLDSLLEDIDSTRTGGIPQHHLLIGQRGMGKTTLLRRLAVSLRERPRESKFIPLSFPEEQWTIDRLSKLWLNCLDSLADTLERSDENDLVEEIDEMVDRLAIEYPNEDLLAEAAEKGFLQIATKIARLPVLLIDNLDLVFDRLQQHELSRLRAFLMRPNSPILIGACVSPPTQTQDYQAPFYEHFKTHYLDRLSLDEMRSVLLKLAERSGNSEILARIDRERPRLIALHALTGGNPRTTVILFQIFTKGFSHEAYQDLEALLDSMTPLYKARFEEFPAQAQVILSALAMHWEPATASQLCELTRLENRHVSPQLDRLRKGGVIEEVMVDPKDRVGPLADGPSPRTRTGYQLAERFFNIWFLMRHATRRDRKSLTFLTRFIESVHTPAERSAMARDLLCRRSLSREERIYGLALEPAVADFGLRYELHDHVQQEIVEASRELRDKIDELIDPSEIPPHRFAFAEIRARLKSALPVGARINPDEFADTILGSPALLERRDSIANQTLDVTKARNMMKVANDESLLLRRTADQDAANWFQNLLRRGTLMDLNDPAQVSDAFRRSDTRAKALLCVRYASRNSKKAVAPDAWSVIKELFAPASKPGNAGDWSTWASILSDHFQRHDESEAAYRMAIELAPNDATLWTNLGNLLQDHLGRYTESEEAYRQAIELDPKFVWSWNGIGNLLQNHLSRFAEAEAAYRKALEFEPKLARAWFGIGNLLQYHLARYTESEAAYRQAIELDPKLAWSWYGLGDLLNLRLKRYAESETMYRKAIELDPTFVPSLRRLGDLLRYSLSRYVEAEEAYRKAIAVDPHLAAAWDDIGDLLQDHFGRYEESEAAYRRAIELEPKLMWPWNGLGNLLQYHLNRYEESEAAYRKAIELDPKSAWPWNGIANLLQYQVGRYVESEAAYRKAIELNPKFTRSWIGLGNILKNHLGGYAESEAAYRRAIELDPKLASAWNHLGDLLQFHLNRYADSEAAYRKAIELDSEFACPWSGLGNLLQYHLPRYAESEAAYRKAIELDPESANLWNCIGLILADCSGRAGEAAEAFRRCIALEPNDALAPKYNLISVLRDQLGRSMEAEGIAADLAVPSEKSLVAGVLLHPMLFAAYAENWGMAATHMGAALDLIADRGAFPSDTFPGWMRATAVLLHLGYGAKLLELLKRRGDEIRLRPWYEAIRAHLRGDRRYLRNIPAEMRDISGALYDAIEIRLKNLPESTRRWSPPVGERSGAKSSGTRAGARRSTRSRPIK